MLFWERDLVAVVLRNGDIKSIRIGEIVEEYEEDLFADDGDRRYVVEVLSSYEGSDLCDPAALRGLSPGKHIVHESRIALVERPKES
jgi:hypothetical protein